jgi:ABC-type glutathione transport system ATPase component
MADDSWRIRPIAHESQGALAQLAQQILQDPSRAMQLRDRVYELLQEDLRIQQERSRGYGRRF